MSSAKDFIEQNIGKASLVKAKKQYDNIMYLVESNIQDDISESLIKQYAEDKYRGKSDFLNWTKAVFKRENFIAFYKYLRFPLASSQLIEKDILPAIERIFDSEDAYFNYAIQGKKFQSIDYLQSDKFSKNALKWLMFNYNDVLVIDIESINDPYSCLIELKDIVAIDCEDDGEIEKIAYKAEVNEIHGFAYIDKESYQFFDEQYNLLNQVNHDLGYCPAAFISANPFGKDKIVRKSIFSHVRESLEEYVFLSTLLKMTNVNGVLPIVTKLKSKDKGEDTNSNPKEKGIPMTANEIGGQNPITQSEITPKASVMQAGTVVDLPVMKKSDGSIDSEIVKNWINFYHTPIEPLTFIKDRIKEIKEDIIVSLVGINKDQNQDAKNEMQIQMSYSASEDKLRMISREMTRLRLFHDNTFLGLKYGIESIDIEGWYGSKFFLESVDSLYNQLTTAPNVIERKNILVQIAKNRNKHDRERATREVILLSIIPYISDFDFDIAVRTNMVDEITFHFQNRFEYWISAFESNYETDIVTFYNSTDGLDSEKKLLITNLIIQMIEKQVLNKKKINEQQTTAN